MEIVESHSCLFLLACICVWHVYIGVHRSQRRVLEPPEMDLQVVVNPLTWMLETELEEQQMLLTNEDSL